MTTFQVSEQTHPTVLPQRRALESAVADNLGSRDETGHRRPADGWTAGLEHGRGEMPDLGTHDQARHAGASALAEAAPAVGNDSITAPIRPGVGAARVFVLDRYGKPLMPCHPARARELLAKGRAVVARHTPFVIRLKDRTVAESTVAGVSMRIDPGSKGTGLAVTDDLRRVDSSAAEIGAVRRGLYAVELQHRGQAIHKSMQQRAGNRRRRRSANLRYRAPRFSNRAHPTGWLGPSLRHRVDSTLSWVGRLSRWAPIREIHLERVSFDTHALAQGREALDGAEYQQGTLAGYEIRQYLLEKWGRACAYCQAQGVPLQIEHIQPKAHGGSDRISNLTLACRPCNQSKGARPVVDFLSRRPEVLAKIMSRAKAPLRDASVMNATRWQLWRRLGSLGIPLHAWSGGRTKYNRQTQNLAKTHTLDALAVGDLPAAIRIVRQPHTILVAASTGRGKYARTTSDRYGFPRLIRPRRKIFFGYATGDLVIAIVPSGNNRGTHTGRVAVRATGKFNIRTADGLVQGIHHRHTSLLQRADGYGYTHRQEQR
jgi:5-methylcytosine-specific restriction endonuclease McrA